MERFFYALDTVMVLLATGALAMAATPYKTRAQAARIMFALAGVLMIIRWFMWAFETDDHWWIRAIVGALIGGFLLAALPAAWNWTKSWGQAIRGTASPQKEVAPITNKIGNITNNKGIITQGQTGNNVLINPIIHEADGLYQSNKKVGSAQPPDIDETAGTATFRFAGFTAYPDPNKHLEYGNLILQCDGVPRQQPNSFSASVSIAIFGLQCKIVGHK